MSGSVSAATAADLVRSTQSPSEDSPVLPVLAKIFGQQHNTTPAEVQPQAVSCLENEERKNYENPLYLCYKFTMITICKN